jgi:hypothetical protein
LTVDACCLPHTFNEEPQSVEEAMKSPHHFVFSLVEKSRNKKNIVTCKWMFKLKRKPNQTKPNQTKPKPFGDIDRFKARLVAPGFPQILGLDFDETFAPVATCEMMRIIFSLSLTLAFKWSMIQFDVTTEFLNGELKEE